MMFPGTQYSLLILISAYEQKHHDLDALAESITPLQALKSIMSTSGTTQSDLAALLGLGGSSAAKPPDSPRTVIALGWLVYAIVYLGFAVSETLPVLIAWFLVYGFYFGFAEGTEKALVADLAPEARRGLAFGI